MNQHIDSATWTTSPRHPCSQYSRWKKQSISTSDADHPFTVSPSSGGGYLISVDGIPRTVVPVFNDTGGVYNLKSGDYKFCWNMEDYVGGKVYFQTITYDGYGCVELAGGNPPLYLPPSTLNSYTTVIKTLALTQPTDFIAVEPVRFSTYWSTFFHGAGYVAQVSLNDPKCANVPQGVAIIGIFPNGEQLYYDPRMILINNTVKDPIFDGVGESAMAGTLCPNVPRNYQNSEFNANDVHNYYLQISCLTSFHRFSKVKTVS